MTLFRFILRSLKYFRWVNLAVIAGVAVATAVLSGALMVGDSVRGSLRGLAIQRLGLVDQALFSQRYFDASLAQRVADEPSMAGRFEVAPAIIVRGGAALDSGASASGVQILAAGKDWAAVKSGECIINSQIADALNIRAPGGDIILSVPREDDTPRDAALARRSREDTLSGLRLRVSRIVSEPDMLSLFTPAGGQRPPDNIWVNLADLQDAVGQRSRINTIFFHERSLAQSSSDIPRLALRRVIKLSDYGLALDAVPNGSQFALTSRSTYIDPPIERAIDGSGIPVQKITVNLINKLSRGDTAIHYAVAAGITSLDGSPLADGDVAVNQWTADQLAAKVGDALSLSFYRRQSDGRLIEVKPDEKFRVARILPMSGIGADPSLTPTYKGLTDADTVANWDPPEEVKIDKSLVTKADEDYWKQYKAAPKLFVNFASAQRLWGQAYGNVTSLRVPADRAAELEKKILELDPALMGLNLRPLRAEQLAAASGTTDFGQLFIGFSFFLIVAAALLVAMLLRLSVEQRARQLGAMAAVGFSPAKLRRMMLAEGMLLSLVGGVIGSFLAVGYTWLMMAGLRTWWLGAVGTTAMRLHVEPRSLVIGFVAAQVVALIAIVWAVRQVGRAAPARLLAGGWEAARPVRSGSGRITNALGIVCLVLGLIIIALGLLGKIRQQDAFLAAGPMLLVSGLFLLVRFLSPSRGQARSLAALAFRNNTRHTARSVLSVGLIALAAFALVTVAAMRQGQPTDTADPRSGAGGYQLLVESEILLLGNPATEQGRSLLGFREPSAPIWQRVEFLSMRRRAGQDVSCLNLTAATNPTILGVPDELIQRGGFTTARDDPWKLLTTSDASGDNPILADDSTAKYILHLPIGSALDVSDSSGATRKLRLMGTLPHSIFQSQLLMSDQNFRNMFPEQSGYGVVLVRASPEDQEQVRRILADELSEYGASVRTTASVLAAYLEVQNTYLSTFQLLAALGLMLGTIGLAVVLVRTIIERRGELALLAAIGFRTATRMRLVLTENALLLVSGLVLGTVCAIIGVLPALRESAREINFGSLGLTLLFTLLVGLCAAGLAVLLFSRVTPGDLRRE